MELYNGKLRIKHLLPSYWCNTDGMLSTKMWARVQELFCLVYDLISWCLITPSRVIIQLANKFRSKEGHYVGNSAKLDPVWETVEDERKQRDCVMMTQSYGDGLAFLVLCQWNSSAQMTWRMTQWSLSSFSVVITTSLYHISNMTGGWADCVSLR